MANTQNEEVQGQIQGQQYYCRIKINDTEIQSENIIGLTIREWINELLPRLELQLINQGYLLETHPIIDGDIIDVLIAKNKDTEASVSMKFVISDFNLAVQSDNRKIILNISGFLKADNFFAPIKTRSFSEKNSKEILQTIVNESGLKFKNPLNITPTDKMTWYQINKSNYDFIYHVLQRSYMPDDSILFYGNSNNEFVYTSIKKELNKQDTIIARYNVDKFNQNALSDEDIKSIWFASYDLTNVCSFFNRIVGYGAEYTYVDNTNGTEISKEYKDDKKITDYIDRQKSLNGKNVLNSMFGIYNDLNLYSDKYFESFQKNYYLLTTFMANSLVININSLNTVKLFDKVNLMLPSLLDNKMSDPYSGLYIVGGITHFVSKGGIYQKMISLNRNGINKAMVKKLTSLVG